MKGDKIKIGCLIFECTEEECANHFFYDKWQAVGATIYASNLILHDMGAVPIKKPRRMSVWEWRKFIDARFRTQMHVWIEFSWRVDPEDGKTRLYNNIDKVWANPSIEFLEYEGVEVV